jgi:SAM-dependent methyltransferase
MLEALAVNGQESVPGAVDACLERTPVARRVLDLGGGHGEYALECARRGLETTMQDQEHVIDGARARGRLAGAGVGLFGGSFFDLFPDERFDLVFCAGVTYTFDAARNTELCRRIRSILAPGGTLAVHIFLRGFDPLAAIVAVQMLSGGRGGDTHSEDDHRRWLAEAGYGEVTSTRLARRPEWLVFARP